MSFANKSHANRIVIIDYAKDVFAQIHGSSQKTKTLKKPIVGSDPEVFIYQEKTNLVDESVYNMPFLFNADGSPWLEANSYLLELVSNKHISDRPTDHARKSAGKLLDYKIFCEENGLDWLDFTGKRPTQRPSYKYFAHLFHSGEKSNAVLNQYTGVVYDFYKHVSKHWHRHIDMDRVDTVKQFKLLVQAGRGSHSITLNKRSQTKATAPASPTPIGYVREDGEDLRPLTNTELGEFKAIVDSDKFSVVERLILYFALYTGARKQSVLTLRMKHLQAFSDDSNCNPDGTYTIYAGPNTGIDTKFDKKQQLYVPKPLADQLVVYANSTSAKKRRNKFLSRFVNDYPHLDHPSIDDIYIFLSDQGNCYYMAKDDPRYPMVKAPQTGQVGDTLKRKIFKLASDKFPADFRYHWLRATYAYQYYQWLLPMVEKGYLSPSEQMSMIQNRLHHKSRETTENYLKLFNNVEDKLMAQEVYERELFGDLSLVVEGDSYA